MKHKKVSIADFKKLSLINSDIVKCIIDDAEYFFTYKDAYPDTYIPTAIDEKEDYLYNYGQMSKFMVQHDYGRE